MEITWSGGGCKAWGVHPKFCAPPLQAKMNDSGRQSARLE
jgi:hypothetical protein